MQHTLHSSLHNCPACFLKHAYWMANVYLVSLKASHPHQFGNSFLSKWLCGSAKLSIKITVVVSDDEQWHWRLVSLYSWTMALLLCSSILERTESLYRSLSPISRARRTAPHMKLTFRAQNLWKRGGRVRRDVARRTVCQNPDFSTLLYWLKTRQIGQIWTVLGTDHSQQ